MMSLCISIVCFAALASCGGKGKAVPTAVEIDWPDASVNALPVEKSEKDQAPQAHQDAGIDSPDTKSPEAVSE